MTGANLNFAPASKDLLNLPLKILISNSYFYQNLANDNSILQVFQNAILLIKDSHFEENFSFGTGGVIRADYKKS